jgi:hypothetical protein
VRAPFLLSIVFAFGASACASEPPVDTSSSGPAGIELETVREHARQFAEDVPVREPGSQEELAAASYILGHLQQAGYVPLLDAVPVGDLVESTNVVALPVEGGEPTTLVAVSYGSTHATGGESIGVFLELARALNAANPGHRVAFVALGAEESPRLGSALGTRRLLKYLDDEDFEPHVITLGDAPELTASGAHAGDIVPHVPDAPVDPRDDIFARSPFEHTTVAGPPDEVGEALLDYLDD